jgi:hypothetical protein
MLSPVVRPFFAVLGLLLAGPAASQTIPSCAAPEASQLDFWLGTWALTWTADDGQGRGTNTLTKTLDGCVVHERFESVDGFRGESVSVYDVRSGQWRQTWVDNRGGYLLLTGGHNEDGVMELRTAPFTHPQTGREQVNRMIWTDVTDEALTWRWQRSLDDGTTWEDQWVITYQRR